MRRHVLKVNYDFTNIFGSIVFFFFSFIELKKSLHKYCLVATNDLSFDEWTVIFSIKSKFKFSSGQRACVK